MGEGGSIPFMKILAKKFSEAEFFITGVLGPYSNAHGPNEFLHLEMAKKLTACIASIIALHYERFNQYIESATPAIPRAIPTPKNRKFNVKKVRF